MRKVVFVGGTGYSGSSFFHMILANDPKGFSCGEVFAFCHPYRSGHVKPVCGCGQDTCTIWQQLATAGTGNVYEAVFERFPEVEFVVDSSKNPYWIQYQTKALLKRGIQAENVLIWKTPLEYAASRKRRGRLEKWDAQWLGYHRLYSSLIDEWRAVQYGALVHQPRTLAEACQYLAIPYFEGKERYWERTHHALFTNYGANMHLYAADKAQSFVANTVQQEKMPYHRTIYYQDVKDPDLLSAVRQATEASARFAQVLDWLEAHDVAHEQIDRAAGQRVAFSAPERVLRQGRHLAQTQIRRLRYGQRAC